jgi:flagellar basal-body rod protein FlgB
MLAENIANVTTPGYRAKQLSVQDFQAALRVARERRREDRAGEFQMPDTRELRTDALGHLHARPSLEPVDNLLFHDGTNARVEHYMADLAENAMMHQVGTELLQNKFERLQSAIRGRVA